MSVHLKQGRSQPHSPWARVPLSSFFPQIAINSTIFLKLYLFSSSFWPSGWASRPPGKALATPLTLRRIVVYILLVYKRVKCSKTLWFLDSGAVENTKHRTLSFPISVGFKRTPTTPNHTASPPPGQTLFVYVSLNYKCIKHRLRKIFNLGRGGSSNCKQKRADRALARGIHVGSGAGPLAGVASG